MPQKAQAASDDDDDDEDEEEASSSSQRPAKRARVATPAESSPVPPVLASRLAPRQRGLGIQVGERLEVEWNGSYYHATVDAITLDGLLNVT